MGRRSGGSRPKRTDRQLIEELDDALARVLDSELAKRENLAELGQTFDLQLRSDGQGSVIQRREVPVSEVESALTRLRPLMLETEHVYVPKVLAVAAKHADDSSGWRDHLTRCRDAWLNFRDGGPYVLMAAWHKGAPPAKMRPDRHIAEDVIYGYLLHRDDARRDPIKLFGEHDRHGALTLYVKDRILLCRETHTLVGDVLTQSWLPRP